MSANNKPRPLLPHDQWLEVVQRTPLVSIDLILRDAQDRILLGYRRNEPAKDYWFVPGGVIRKDEQLDEAFARVAGAELGITAHRTDARLMGVHQHFYETNFALAPSVSTHYVVLAHELRLDRFPASFPPDQHHEWQAITIPELLSRKDVHRYTKAYFK